MRIIAQPWKTPNKGKFTRRLLHFKFETAQL